MADFKVVLNDPKTGKSYQREIKDPISRKFIGLKIGDMVKGEIIDLTGYEFQITGGSDYAGFPMRKDVEGSARKKILAVQGVGLKKKAKGIKQRKLVAGNTIHAKIAQINLKIMEEGKQPLGGEKAEEKKGEKPKEEKKETKT
ncbi:30S ribosomal protein S6e [Candidatus Woesearchaeota archaeon]|nr:30S ribosomal protein S6e [Candidatus Woesearchaeota archaeon]